LSVRTAGRRGVVEVAAAPESIRRRCGERNDREQGATVPAYNTSEFKKGLKVQIDGDPYIM